MSNQPILIVDHEPEVRLTLQRTLTQAGYAVESAASGADVLEQLKPEKFSMLIADAEAASPEGTALLACVKNLEPHLPVILTTTQGSINGAVQAMQQGAADYLLKPFATDLLIAAIQRACRQADKDRGDPFRNQRSDSSSPPTARVKLITRNERLLKLLEKARSIAVTDATILIQGESGTGKEVLAKVIHSHSRRADGPYVALNCAALPENLAESELFGHEKGAFTGAIARKAGKFELATHGTLVLDEISEMSLPLQAKLLRVLQEREIDRVGGGRAIPIDARIIVISNVNLQQAVRAGSFRQDLFYRINVIPFTIPPLRNRKGDISALAEHFMTRFRQCYGIQRRLSEEALQRLTEYDWPGNVRELENMLERTALMAPADTIEVDDLCFDDLAAASGMGSDTAPSTIQAGLTVREMERELILKTLNEVRDNRTRAAELLGISIRTLRNKLNEYKVSEMPEEQQAQLG